MNIKNLLVLCVLALAVALPTSGCRKKPANVTQLPGQTRGAVGDPGAEGLGAGGTLPDSGAWGADSVTGLAGLESFEGMTMDRGALASYTVYFDFDSSVLRASERGKVTSVAGELRSRSGVKLLIEGHTDERGTEEYNRALGERRALSLREALMREGVSGDRIRTISYGEDRPVDPGSNEAAWARNRRGEFVLLLP
jgi:peptidoglycan-associated lipoprotein